MSLDPDPDAIVPVVWLHKKEVPPHCRQDELYAADIIAGVQKKSPLAPLFSFQAMSNIHPSMRHAIVLFPAGAHDPKDVHWLNQQLQTLDRVVLFLTSDEAQTFPVSEIRHPDMQLWVQLPRPENWYPDGTTFITEGSMKAWQYADPEIDKGLCFYFGGQINHPQRQTMMNQLLKSRLKPSATHFNEQFFTGLDRPAYLAFLRSARLAPAPSGVQSQSSFRCQEALELGCVPLVARTRSDGLGAGFWGMVMPEVPLPIIDYWEGLNHTMKQMEEVWGQAATDCHAGWHFQRREHSRKIASQALWLQRRGVPERSMTVVIPTSPIPAHPDLGCIEQTVASIRVRTDAEILIMVDGVRSEQQERRPAYERYTRRLLLAAERWPNVTPIVFDTHLHQAEMLRRTLRNVDANYLLYVEHDTPFVGVHDADDLDFDRLMGLMEEEDLNLLRFHHEAEVLKVHRYLMVGTPSRKGYWPTMQWSQRPHLARTSFYRELLGKYFAPAARTMIEDVMYGICHNARINTPDRVWDSWRTAIYHPDTPSIQRSWHLDGRGDDPKFEMRWAYPDDVLPDGAPNPVRDEE